VGIGTLTRGLRPGLVAILFLLAVSSCFSQEQSGAVSHHSLLQLKSTAEIEKSECTRFYRNPLALLLFLPGTLFFIYALATKKRKGLLPFFALLFLLGSASPVSERLTMEGERLFQAGEYAASLAQYRQARSLLPCNPALSYNLALVYHHLGERGYAVHFLRESLKQRPGDVQARAALQALENSYGLAGQVPPPLPVHPDLAYLLLVLLTNASLVMAAFVVRLKRVRFLISLVLLGLAAVGSSCFFVGRLRASSQPVGVIVSERADLLRVPESDSKPWFELPSGTSFLIRGRGGGYYLVETSSGVKGWVPMEVVLLD